MKKTSASKQLLSLLWATPPARALIIAVAVVALGGTMLGGWGSAPFRFFFGLLVVVAVLAVALAAYTLRGVAGGKYANFTPSARTGGAWMGGAGVASFDHGPSTNIDGSPMVGLVDIHGNPYGVTQGHDSHAFNTNGAPMVSDAFDVNGDTYGSPTGH